MSESILNDRKNLTFWYFFLVLIVSKVLNYFLTPLMQCRLSPEVSFLGEKNPYVACYIVDKLTNNSACNAAEKPDISSLGTKTCNTEACDSFEWNTIDGTCNVSCGDGKNC